MADTYLLTGAGGFLGQIINDALIAGGNNVIKLGRSHQDINADISKPFVLAADIRPSVVIHAAGKAHSIPGTPAAEKEFFDVNFEGTRNLCNAIGSAGNYLRSFVFISTVAVYGVDSGEYISETHPLEGVSPYAKSKILAEEWLKDWAANNKITLSILRLPLVAGPDPPGNLGAMIKGIKSGRYFSIGQADARKSMVWARDIGNAMPKIAQVGGIYNLTDGFNPTFGELENAIAQALNKKKIKKMPYHLARLLAIIGDMMGSKAPINSDKLRKISSVLTFDDSKAKDLLGWSPTPVITKIHEII